MQEIRPKAISLKELHDGKQFYAPGALPEELQQQIKALFENYTQSEKQNQAYQAAQDIKAAFEKLAELGVEMPMYHQLPLALKQLFDIRSEAQQGPLIHQLPVNSKLFTESYYSHVE